MKRKSYLLDEKAVVILKESKFSKKCHWEIETYVTRYVNEMCSCLGHYPLTRVTRPFSLGGEGEGRGGGGGEHITFSQHALT